MPKTTDSYVAEENKRKTAQRKERQAQQAIEGVTAMADYRRAADAKLERMIQLRAARLKRAASGA